MQMDSPTVKGKGSFQQLYFKTAIDPPVINCKKSKNQIFI